MKATLTVKKQTFLSRLNFTHELKSDFLIAQMHRTFISYVK